MSWIGGKKALRELIVRLFPLYYERYIEVFGGGGWVLFHKPPGNDFEVYNDFNGLLGNLYRCVRDKPEELMEALRYVLNAREDFDRIRSALARDSPASDVQRAAWFYQLIRYSYASGLTSFGSQPHDMRSNFSLIEQAHRRLAKVVIENKDFEKLLHQYDRPVSFFYLDPPYHATEGYYQNIGEDGFTEADHIRLRDALMRIEGKFLLSYNDDAFVRGLYDRPGIYLMETTRINNIKQRYDNGAQFPELLIANYDLRDSAGRLNYLKDASELTDFFRAAFLSVREGGALFVDLSTPYKLEHVLGNHFIGDETPEIAYLWQNRYNRAQGYVDLNLAIFVRQKDETYLRIGEQQRQYAHSAQLLTELMEAVGFTDIRLYGDKKLSPPEPHAVRWFLAARKPLTEEAPPTVGERMTEVPQA